MGSQSGGKVLTESSLYPHVSGRPHRPRLTTVIRGWGRVGAAAVVVAWVCVRGMGESGDFKCTEIVVGGGGSAVYKRAELLCAESGLHQGQT